MHAGATRQRLLSVCLLGLQVACAKGPAIDSPAVAALVDRPAVVEGRRFGAPSSDSALLLAAGGETLRIESADVTLWQDDRIEFTPPSEARSGQLRVVTGAGESAEKPFELYRYTNFDIPPTPGTNAVPLAIAFDPAGRVWVNQEFHLSFQRLDIATGVVTGIDIPKPPDPGPFGTTLFGDARTQITALGEDILLDAAGRVWLSQGGGLFYDGAFPNHSRIVAFDPAAAAGQEFQVYNIPGDQNEIIGLMLDPGRGRLWFTQGGPRAGAALVSFDPDRLPFDNQFDFSVSLDDQICADGAPDDDCYHFYPLPENSDGPAHMALDAQGFVWYTAFLSNAIGRLDPETGAAVEFPLPRAIGQAAAALFFGAGPWQILIGPGGEVFFNEFFDGTLSRFDAARVGDPACQALNAAGENPCVTSLVIPGFDPIHEQVHSIALDGEGRLWFTIHDPDREADSEASLGFVTPGFGAAVRFPSLAPFPGAGQITNTGIALDPATGDVWFNEFLRKRIGRFARVF
jgi:streptogramin lyase